MTGHGTLANKSDIVEYNTMLKIARERVEKLFKAGKSEAEVVEARPLKDLDAKWAANDEAAINFLKMVYNSFKRSRAHQRGKLTIAIASELLSSSGGISRNPAADRALNRGLSKLGKPP